jgi:hypothetical protein
MELALTISGHNGRGQFPRGFRARPEALVLSCT